MSEDQKYFQFGLTKSFPCNYLANENERLIVVTNGQYINNENYQRLLMSGFRRSGDQVYRPHCQQCKACESIRIPVKEFKPSRSQKRILATNRDLEARIVFKANDSYFPLYQNYINSNHRDGSMYPANKEQYTNFIFSEHISQLFIEIYQQEKLVAVAVCDNLVNSLSALYTFYDPTLSKRSLGKYAILKQIELSKKLHKHYVYLGYQIDSCAKMNYKSQYYPHERLQNENWIRFEKN